MRMVDWCSYWLACGKSLVLCIEVYFFLADFNGLCYREMAVGNSFGGWALSSYGAFWISIGIIFTPGGFGVAAAYGGENAEFYNAIGLYMMVSFSAIVNILLQCLT